MRIVGLLASAILPLVVAGCGDGDSVPLERQSQSQSGSEESGGAPGTTFSAPLPSASGDDDVASEPADETEAESAGDDAVPLPDVTPDEILPG